MPCFFRLDSAGDDAYLIQSADAGVPEEALAQDIDHDTKSPFSSLFRWPWEMPPPAVGLSGYDHIDATMIARMLEGARDEKPSQSRGAFNALIEDLVKGNGAARPAGRPKKEESNDGIGPDPIMKGRGKSRANHASSLAARLAESSVPNESI
jgi:hypothetical protein